MKVPSPAYVTAVPSDFQEARTAFADLGLIETWSGAHPLYSERASLFATAGGGVLLVDAETAYNADVAASGESSEAWDRTCLSVEDLDRRWEICQSAEGVASCSDIVSSPLGRSFVVDLESGTDDRPLRLEFMAPSDDGLWQAKDSSFSRIESIAMVFPARERALSSLSSIGLEVDDRVSDGHFTSLGCINSVIWVGSAYLEINEPVEDGGVMSGLLARLDGGGVFGLNLQPVSMADFVTTARDRAISVNTEEPILLDVELEGERLRVADIITVNPRWTKGARIFVLDPHEYPWNVADGHAVG